MTIIYNYLNSVHTCYCPIITVTKSFNVVACSCRPTAVTINKMTFLKLSYIKSFRSITGYLYRLPKYVFQHFVPSQSAVIFTIKVIYDTRNNYKVFYVILFIYLLIYLLSCPFKTVSSSSPSYSTFLPYRISPGYMHYINTVQ